MVEFTGHAAMIGTGPLPARKAAAEVQPVQSALGRWMREPFLHFLLLGTVLFCVTHYWEQHRQFTRIIITPATVRSIADNYRLQYGRAPSAAQLDALVEGFIQEEVYYHEGLKLGLDQDDEIVRRRLVQKYEFLQQDLAIVADPADADLQAYFHSHADGYRTPQTVAFSQVFFSVDSRGESVAHEAAAAEARRLNAAGAAVAPQAGDPFPGPESFPALSADEAQRVFGQGELSASLFHLRTGEWSQPLRSTYGWHIIRVDGYAPPRAAAFVAVRDQVRRDYLEDARSARNAANYAQLRQKFEIVRE